MKKFAIYPITFVLLLATIWACKPFEFNEDDLDINLNFNIIKTKVAVNLIDAATQLPVGESSPVLVSVSILGDDRNQVIDMDAYFKTVFESTDGFVEFGTNPYGKIPTESNPVKLVVVVEAAGYLQTSLPLNLVRQGVLEVEIPMVQISNPCDGVDIKVSSSAGFADDGILRDDLNAQTDDRKLKILVKKGTLLTDRDGSKLNGELSVTLGYFSPTNEESLSAFPGGFTVTVKDADGQMRDGNFVTAGFAAIEISDQSGKLAAGFDSGSLILDMVVDSEVINYETNEKVKEGDVIPIWSYDVETGKWAFEENMTVKPGPHGLEITKEVHHLSWYNLDWFVTGFCSWSKLFIFASDHERGYDQRFCYKYTMFRRSGAGWIYWRAGVVSGRVSDDAEQTYYNYLGWRNAPPWQIKLVFEACPSCEDPLFSTPPEQIFEFCDNTTEVLYLTPGNYNSLFIEAYIKCTDTGVRFRVDDTYRIRYRVLGQDCWTYLWVYKGMVIINPVWQNTTYEVQVYDGGWKPETPYQHHTNTETHIVVDIEVECGG